MIERKQPYVRQLHVCIITATAKANLAVTRVRQKWWKS